MRISVVIPSRCAADPRSRYEDLFLERALQSVRWQSVKVAQVCIGVQAVTPELERLVRHYADWPVEVRQTEAPGQAAALNAAAAAASGDLIAFLEDDDVWLQRRLDYGLKVLRETGCDFVSSNQLEESLDGTESRINDFPTPSGWLMTMDLWRRSGGFDPAFRWHLDNAFLGRIGALGARRVHLAEKGADAAPRDWLQRVARHSGIARTPEPAPLVTRVFNPDGGMATILKSPDAKRQSEEEVKALCALYGDVPW